MCLVKVWAYIEIKEEKERRAAPDGRMVGRHASTSQGQIAWIVVLVQNWKKDGETEAIKGSQTVWSWK